MSTWPVLRIASQKCASCLAGCPAGRIEYSTPLAMPRLHMKIIFLRSKRRHAGHFLRPIVLDVCEMQLLPFFRKNCQKTFPVKLVKISCCIARGPLPSSLSSGGHELMTPAPRVPLSLSSQSLAGSTAVLSLSPQLAQRALQDKQQSCVELGKRKTPSVVSFWTLSDGWLVHFNPFHPE